MKACPVCNEPLEAAVKIYLDDVEIEDGKIVSFVDSSENLQYGLGVELEIYCVNSHSGPIADAIGDWPKSITLHGVEYGT